MEDESNHNNHRDATKERFGKLGDKFINISHNISLLMVALMNKFGPFEEVGGSNS
jgi:hypothetical protein